MSRLQAYSQVFYRLIHYRISQRYWPNDEQFLHLVYKTCLRRTLDADGKARYLTLLKQKSWKRRDVLWEVTQSEEFQQVGGLPVHPLDAQHGARMKLVQEHLPSAKTIVDLGGAAKGQPEGALLGMGYPHQPQEIVIIDLPPDARLHGKTGAETAQDYTTADGVQVRYLYQSMADMAQIADDWADMVWSGESIEHISEADADVVCQEAYRVLKPGGYFCLDTPNGVLTRLQSPDEMIHPEHQKEYQVHELRDKLTRWGFDVVDAKGICPMPNSIRNGEFDIGEQVQNICVSDTAEEGYMFYLKAQKR